LIALLIGVVLVGGGFFYMSYQSAQAASKTTYQTVQLTIGDLRALVGATGTVRANQTTSVNWQTTGRIGKINVKEGDKVTVNQILAELDPSTYPMNIISSKSDLVTALRNLDNLKNSDLSKAQAQQALAQAEQSLKDAQGDRYRKNLARTSKATVDSAQADLIIAQDTLKKAQENYDRVANFAENDVNRAQSFSRLAAAQKTVDQDQWNLAWLLARPDNLEVSQADAAIVVAQAKLKDAQREWDRLKNGPDPQDIIAAQAKVDSIQATLTQTVIKAPINGVVTDVKSMVGDQVSAGTVSFRIDDLSHQLVDVPVAEVDINRVKLAQPAKLTFDAIQGKDYNGKVTDISPFGTTANGVVNFTVTVELTDADAQVRSGMTAAVNLTVESLTGVLLVPNRAVRLQNGKRVVHILENGIPKAVEITLGSTNDTYTQIASGPVKAGDSVVLNPPTTLTGPGGGGGIGGIFGGGR
jgi:HlyD family secretion protein